MAADTALQFWGMWYLVGHKVSVTIGGLDCGDYVVGLDGSVIVNIGGDPAGLLTADYIVNLDGYSGESAVSILYSPYGATAATYTIPVVIGCPYTSQLQLLRAVSADDLKSPVGPGYGGTRRAHWVGALVSNTIPGLRIGTDFANTLVPADLYPAGTATANTAVQLFTGVLSKEVSADPTVDGQLTVQVDRPSPATIEALTTWQEAEPR